MRLQAELDQAGTFRVLKVLVVTPCQDVESDA